MCIVIIVILVIVIVTIVIIVMIILPQHQSGIWVRAPEPSDAYSHFHTKNSQTKNL